MDAVLHPPDLRDAPTESRADSSPRADAALRRAVFVDKDGTLIRDVPYNVDPARLELTRGAREGLRLLADAGFAIVVVTNQPGLAAGRFTRAEFARLTRALGDRVRAECGVELTDIRCCPHAAGADGIPGCPCRKPAPGLLLQAALAHRLDLRRSWLIGDILDDVEAGHRAGCRSVLLDVGNETIWRMSPLRRPEARCVDLLEAARFILRHDGEASDE